ncbi:MAG: hypothetical protein P8012_08610 [Desulfobacterales bacterium]
MKLKITVLLFFVLSISGCASLTPAETQVAVQELVTQVQVAVDRIAQNREISSTLPPLKSAELTLSSRAERDTNGKVSLFLSAGGGKKQTDANSITLVLVPNKLSSKALTKEPGQDIADAVVAAVSALKGVQGLTLKSLTVVASLEIVKNVQGGFDIELSGVSVEGGKKKVITSGNSLKLVFERTDKVS